MILCFCRILVRDPKLRRFPKLRSCTSAGEPLNPEVIALWFVLMKLIYTCNLYAIREKATILKIREFYGQSETTGIIGNLEYTKLKPGSMGLPSPGYDMQVRGSHNKYHMGE